MRIRCPTIRCRVVGSDDPIVLAAKNAGRGGVRKLQHSWVRFLDIQYGKSGDLISYLQQQVKDRGIDYLVHFTHVDNLPSIKRLGLLPRNVLIKLGIPHIALYPNRYDGTSGICLSVMYPNSSMLYHKRMEYGHDCWAFILVSPDVLWKNDCAFFAHNAACAMYRGINLDDLKTTDAFNAVFAEPQNGSRRAMGLHSWCTTDLQAEVKAYKPISQDYFLEIIDRRSPRYHFFLNRRDAIL